MLEVNANPYAVVCGHHVVTRSANPIKPVAHAIDYHLQTAQAFHSRLFDEPWINRR
jgi:hypothetical protein